MMENKGVIGGMPDNWESRRKSTLAALSRH